MLQDIRNSADAAEAAVSSREDPESSRTADTGWLCPVVRKDADVPTAKSEGFSSGARAPMLPSKDFPAGQERQSRPNSAGLRPSSLAGLLGSVQTVRPSWMNAGWESQSVDFKLFEVSQSTRFRGNDHVEMLSFDCDLFCSKNAKS